MKYLIVAVLIVASLPLAAQSREFGLGYTFMSPVGDMQSNIRQGHGLTVDFYLLPSTSRFAAGLELNYTVYGYSKTRQLYTLDDGSQADMDIAVNNSITTFMVAGRYYMRDAGIFRPYINLKGGYSLFRTDLNIYDPNDWDNCAPIENELLITDGTFVASAGAGAQYDLSGLIKKMRPGLMMVNVSINLTMGGRVNYMNTDAPSHAQHQPTASDVTARFINTQTQIVHEHHVGYVYTSYAEMVDMRLGLVLRAGGR